MEEQMCHRVRDEQLRMQHDFDLHREQLEERHHVEMANSLQVLDEAKRARLAADDRNITDAQRIRTFEVDLTDTR